MGAWQAECLVQDSKIILDREGRIPEDLAVPQPWPLLHSETLLQVIWELWIIME